MEYETRRARRLRSEREKALRLRPAKFFAVAIILAIIAIIGIALYNAVQSSVEQQAEEAAKLAAQTAIENSPSYKIQRDLPAKIDEINKNLGLPTKVSADDVPTTNAVAVAIIDLSDKNRGGLILMATCNLLARAPTNYTLLSR
jgi:Na+-translocating ferredoxin:NAD+ oxidoreductase RnfG subunit